MRTAFLFLVLGAITGCAPSDPGRTRVLVFAASSLREAFEDIQARFEAEHPDVAVDLHFAGTSRLVFQLEQGAPADVFASADAPNMVRATALGRVRGEPHDFARNELAVVTAAGNARGVAGLADFARTDLRLALCGPEVPAGRYAREALARAGVSARPGSDEPHVRAVVAKVVLGEVDAGIVYRTDVAAAGAEVHGVDVPAEHQVAATYSIAALHGGRAEASAARAFVDFVLDDAGRAALGARGFLLP